MLVLEIAAGIVLAYFVLRFFASMLEPQWEYGYRDESRKETPHWKHIAIGTSVAVLIAVLFAALSHF